MDEMTGHPDDEQLFDLVDGALDAAGSEQLRSHLARCAACAAFVEAAGAGATAARGAAEPMPEVLDAQLHAAVRVAWRERRDAIAASELEHDAIAAPAAQAHEAATALDAVPVPAVSSAGAPASHTRRLRRLVPIAAFALLATLAGTSVLIGDEPRTPDRGDQQAAQDDVGSLASDDAFNELYAEPEDGAAGSSAAPGADSGVERSASPSTADGPEQPSAESPTVAVPGVEPSSDELLCIATADATQMQLPDGRIPQQVLRAPLGIYVVCG
jgi:hypothetical protein